MSPNIDLMLDHISENCYDDLLHYRHFNIYKIYEDEQQGNRKLEQFSDKQDKKE